MASRQRIVRVRRDYNQWVANQTLEDYALRFTAKSARRWSPLRVANTALGAISFLALEAIGGTITLNYGFSNAAAGIVVVCLLIFLTSLPIGIYAARYGVDIDLLTRGAGFGYIGSTVTSLIYASFTFIFFAIEAVILASMLEICFGIPQAVGYLICSLAVIPLVTHGITFISRFQLWSQPIWLVLQLLPFAAIALHGTGALDHWVAYRGSGQKDAASFDILLFGAAASVVFSLIAQIGEQVDILRFLPERQSRPGGPGLGRAKWWAAVVAGGPGWIVIGMLKLLAGSFLACLAVMNGVVPGTAAQPVVMYRVAFGYVVGSPTAALVLAACFVAVSQVKINITNAYAGALAWSNFFSRLTHRHPGRVVWLVFNIAIAVLLMELGIYQAIEHTLVIYSDVAAAWVGALVADLVINKPFGLSPPYIEFKRAHLYDINPVGVGAMLLAVAISLSAYAGLFGAVAEALSPFLAFAVAFGTAPLIAWATDGRFYLARKPRAHWAESSELQCVICEHSFEPEDMAFCPAYAGAICSLCCSLDSRCHDACKPGARLSSQILTPLGAALPANVMATLGSSLGRCFAMFALLAGGLGLTLFAIYWQAAGVASAANVAIAAGFWKAFLLLVPVAGVVAWLLVLVQESRRVAEEETRRQTSLLMSEIRAHRRTDAQLQKAKEVAESANLAKSRYVVGISHELRSPLNAILGYAQLLERDTSLPERRRNSIGIIRRSGEHMAALIEGLLDIAKIEAGRIELYRDRVRLPEFMEQLVNMFQLQAEAKGVRFIYSRPAVLPEYIYTDERRLRQILINLLSNAVKFTNRGSVELTLRRRGEVAEFEIRDTGIGISESDISRVFEPFERVESAGIPTVAGVGLGLTITRLLAQIMGGDIAVESEPGQGSRFRVRLMLSEAMQPQPSSPADHRIQGYEGERLTVLVADDDPVHRGLIEDVLSPLGFVLFSAEDGIKCLEIAADCQPDLFLIDISMPGMNGWELARRLRESSRNDPIILMISANAGELTGAFTGHRYHDDVLAKPISLPQLLEKIGQRMRINWTAMPHARVDLSPDREAAAAGGLLTPRQIEELCQLGAIGYVRGIQERLTALETALPQLRPYIVHLRGFVAEFRLDAFMAALRKLEDELSE
jgi:signal transduction histidine kinase/CheY-like chemotaxis protein